MKFTYVHNKKAPCVDCPNKGCGAYHDICPEYTEFRDACKSGGQNARDEKRRTGAYIPHKKRRT